MDTTRFVFFRVGGHFDILDLKRTITVLQSNAVNNQYHIRYTIEPMLELLWTEGGTDATRYRVLFPIKTPLMPRPPQLVDSETQMKSLLSQICPISHLIQFHLFRIFLRQIPTRSKRCLTCSWVRFFTTSIW